MIEHAWIIPVILIASYWLILFFGKRLPNKGHEIGIPAVLTTFVMSCIVLFQWVTGDHSSAEPVRQSVSWFSIGDVDVRLGVSINGMVAILLFVVTLVSSLVHLFSTEYVKGDRRYTQYFAALSLFTAGMLTMVMSDSILLLLFGWETMGLCSFMLIGHWFEEQANSNAALKAFLTTRTGDIGLLVGLSTLFFAAGKTFDIGTINSLAASGLIEHWLLLFASSWLLLAVVGKSAQVPLHIWLPDAMAGPTPVSALIHAATMVVAGIFLVARIFPVFFYGFDIGAGGINPIALIGGITIVVGASMAFVQQDLKKVLAYSTISQLGYMVAALGVGAWTAALFHLFTHAFFKACLFLGAGSVSHGVHHTFDMRKMGGLRKYMPTTHITFLLSTLALAGIAPLSGFWSKDEILNGAYADGYNFVLIMGSIGAFMTATYMGRAYFKTFWGEYKGHGTPHESPKIITVPLVILAFFAVFSGFLNAPGIEKFSEWTEMEVPLVDASGQPIVSHGEGETPATETGSAEEHAAAAFSVEPTDLNAAPGAAAMPSMTSVQYASVSFDSLGAPRELAAEAEEGEGEGEADHGGYFIPPHHKFNTTLAILTSIPALVGIALAVWIWYLGTAPKGVIARSAFLRWVVHVIDEKFYFDWIAQNLVVKPIKGPIARACYWFNQNVIDGIVNGVGTLFGRGLSTAASFFDRNVIDGAVNGSAAAVGASGDALRKAQDGHIQRYALFLFASVGLIGLAVLVLS
ncbi:MAG: NADH-quinone oxidoreductase subunit L [Acidimicrobiia bacterium]|jgi:NADH-quinone oxidoreductase subunit L|nr:NADH-quinone oxidoreductase subunit L [Acidimicrobiia bacterium]